MTDFLNRHTLHLTPLSPIHLGTGEDYEPTNYLIADGVLYTFDPARAILNPDEERELHAAAQSGDLQHIQRYFHHNPKPYIAAATHASSVSKGISTEYQKNYGEIVQRESKGKNVHNRFQIERTATNPHNHQPYIPGSALKGSLRTALLEQLSADYRGNKPTAKQATHYENGWCPKMYADKRRANKKQRRHGIFEVWKLKIPFAVPVAVDRI